MNVFCLPDEYEGTPEEALALLTKHIGELDAKIKEKQSEIDHVLSSKKEKILAAVAKLKKFSKNFDIRRLAAVTGADKKNFYIICFWMTARDAKKFKAEIESDPNVICLIHDDNKNRVSQPPVKLRNQSCLSRMRCIFVCMVFQIIMSLTRPSSLH